ncbi:MAG TPA: polyprenyl synthetase family protein [Thermoanaerobaculia bacterium]
MSSPGSSALADTVSVGSPIGQVLELIAPKLDLVEQELQKNFSSPIRTIQDVADHVLEGGGKRLRPTLLLLVSRMLGYEGRKDVVLGAVIEFIHTATLIHDDIIDDSAMRRGRASINYKWGNHLTVLIGDYLYTHAMRMALDTGDLEIVKMLCSATIEMTEGEILGLQNSGRADLTSHEYFDLIGRKTAALFGASARVPAMLVGLDESRQKTLYDYGHKLGVAFQLVDDLLDFTSSSEMLGKPALADLKDGKATLPVILALSRANEAERRKIESVLRTKSFDEIDPLEVQEIVTRHGAIDETRKIAREYARDCKRCLSEFPDSPAREALEFAAEFVLDRDR